MEEKHSQLGDFGGIPGAPSGPPVSAKNPNPPFEVHEVARIFPPMSDPEFNDLKSDIAKNGLREPLWIYQGKIIDGRNRLRACTELGITPATREWNGEGTLLDFVVSLNLHRRHLNETQRAMVAARLKPSFEKAAKERLLAGKELDPSHNCGQGKTADLAGKLLNVSKGSVERATRVIAKGCPELIALVDRSELPVSKAATLVTLPHSNQRDILKDGIPFALQIARELEEEARAARRQKNRDSEAEVPPPTLDFGLATATRDGKFYRLEVGDDWPEVIKRAAAEWIAFDRAIDFGGIIIVKKKGA
jgi:hypothetical protein